MSTHRKNVVFRAVLIVLIIVASRRLRASQVQDGVTIDDLVGRVHIPLVSLSPDGRNVAYVTVKGQPRGGTYEIAVNVIATDGNAKALVLSRYQLKPDATFERDTGGLRKTVAQFAWSPGGKQLVYTTHAGPSMEARVRAIDEGLEKTLLKGFREIELKRNGKKLEFRVIGATVVSKGTDSQPQDHALLVKDGYRFYGPLINLRERGRVSTQKWSYLWGMRAPVRETGSDALSYVGFPEEWAQNSTGSSPRVREASDEYTFLGREMPSPDGTQVAFVEEAMRGLQDPGNSYRVSRIVVKQTASAAYAQPLVLVPYGTHDVSFEILGWSIDGKQLYYLRLAPQFSSLNTVTREGRQTEMWKGEWGLFAGSPGISENGATAVFVRSTNLVPDELIKVDLRNGSLTALLSPNAAFKTKALPSVRFVPIEGVNGDFYGRLYLPIRYEKGKKYPLVFTNYISGPGFNASVGDEVPILTLTAHDIAVFALSSKGANETSETGDFRVEISRVQRPLAAMDWVRRKLTEEGIIDPERCGLTGLSYGAEIAMYAYWKSTMFQAVSVAGTSWEPTNYVLGGVPYSRFLDERGFVVPGDGAYAKWKELSAGLNARADLPPLLLQSADAEEYFGNVETWFRLRRAGAQVEWYEYPNEGHVKRNPDDKWWVYQRNLDWFRFWLKGEEDADPAKAAQYTRWREMRTLQQQAQEQRAVPLN